MLAMAGALSEAGEFTGSGYRLAMPLLPPAVTRAVVVMGVSGTGKSTIGRALADALRLPFVEGDDLHPPANVAKMAAGIPLTDADRAPWLDLVAARLAGPPAVVACSALRRIYRDRLRMDAPDLALVYLHGTRELLAGRMAARPGHFMPTSLLDSQLATLEPPTPDENALAVDVVLPPAEIVAEAVEWLRDGTPAPRVVRTRR
jgi:gluconokinase